MVPGGVPHHVPKLPIDLSKCKPIPLTMWTMIAGGVLNHVLKLPLYLSNGLLIILTVWSMCSWWCSP
jgi:hypothetical protein